MQFEEQVKKGLAAIQAIKKDAEQWEAKSAEWDSKSDHALHKHHQWAQATTAEQVAIALAAITLLTNRKWLMYATYGVAAVGLGLGVLAML